MEKSENPLEGYSKDAGHQYPYIITKTKDNTEFLLVLLPSGFVKGGGNQLSTQDEFQKCTEEQGISGKVIIVWEINKHRIDHLPLTSRELDRNLRSLSPDSFRNPHGYISYPC